MRRLFRFGYIRTRSYFAVVTDMMFFNFDSTIAFCPFWSVIVGVTYYFSCLEHVYFICVSTINRRCYTTRYLFMTEHICIVYLYRCSELENSSPEKWFAPFHVIFIFILCWCCQCMLSICGDMFTSLLYRYFTYVEGLICVVYDIILCGGGVLACDLLCTIARCSKMGRNEP